MKAKKLLRLAYEELESMSAHPYCGISPDEKLMKEIRAFLGEKTEQDIADEEANRKATP